MSIINTDDIDLQKLKEVIYHYFYNGPIAGASDRLSRIIRNHLAGEPLLSFDEVLDEYAVYRYGLEGVKEGRAEFWKAWHNAPESNPAVVADFIDFSRRKKLYDCICKKLSLPPQ